jgi:hypothetical protein
MLSMSVDSYRKLMSLRCGNPTAEDFDKLDQDYSAEIDAMADALLGLAIRVAELEKTSAIQGRVA